MKCPFDTKELFKLEAMELREFISMLKFSQLNKTVYLLADDNSEIKGFTGFNNLNVASVVNAKGLLVTCHYEPGKNLTMRSTSFMVIGKYMFGEFLLGPRYLRDGFGEVIGGTLSLDQGKVKVFLDWLGSLDKGTFKLEHKEQFDNIERGLNYQADMTAWEYILTGI
ncbi:MAG: hypothetical protein ACRCVV_11020 [Shewanella sp.]